MQLFLVAIYNHSINHKILERCNTTFFVFFFRFVANFIFYNINLFLKFGSVANFIFSCKIQDVISFSRNYPAHA